jgi:hypothetical protein
MSNPTSNLNPNRALNAIFAFQDLLQTAEAGNRLVARPQENGCTSITLGTRAQAGRTRSGSSAYAYVARPLEATRSSLGPRGRKLIDAISEAMQPRCEEVDVVWLKALFNALAGELLSDLTDTPLSQFSRHDYTALTTSEILNTETKSAVTELQWLVAKYEKATTAGKNKIKRQCLKETLHSPRVRVMQRLYRDLKSLEFKGSAGTTTWEAPMLRLLSDLLPPTLKDSPLLQFAAAGLKRDHNLNTEVHRELLNLNRLVKKYELASEAKKRDIRRKFQDTADTPLAKFMSKLLREMKADERRNRAPVNDWEAPLKAFLAEMLSAT